MLGAWICFPKPCVLELMNSRLDSKLACSLVNACIAISQQR